MTSSDLFSIYPAFLRKSSTLCHGLGRHLGGITPHWGACDGERSARARGAIVLSGTTHWSLPEYQWIIPYPRHTSSCNKNSVRDGGGREKTDRQGDRQRTRHEVGERLVKKEEKGKRGGAEYKTQCIAPMHTIVKKNVLKLPPGPKQKKACHSIFPEIHSKSFLI